MQPKYKMKKTLLAGAVVLGLGNAFHASSDVFGVAAGAIPDVVVANRADLGQGAAEISFGATIKSSQTATNTCTIVGASNAFEDDMLVNLDGSTDGNDDADQINVAAPLEDAATNDYVAGDITGNGCVPDASGDQSGTYMVLEADGGSGTTVTVDIPDVTGTGWTWSPGAETCATNYTGTTGADTCTNFSGVNQLTGLDMSDTDALEMAAGATALDGVDGNEGKIKILLAGTLTFDGTAITGPVADTIVVTVTYE